MVSREWEERDGNFERRLGRPTLAKELLKANVMQHGAWGVRCAGLPQKSGMES